jgi:hypothetical protein
VTVANIKFPDWWFPRQSPGVKANENTNGEHFSDLNVSGKAQAFIRESFQNSIDGALTENEPVLIRLFFSGEQGALPPSIWRKYFGSLLKHVEASIDELPISSSELDDLRTSKCRFLVLEDFGTSGLTGEVDAWDLASGATEDNHFYHFFRTVGRTGKSAGQLGAWGIGKFVFLMASQIRAMIGYTVPAIGPSAGRNLIMGQATLRYHVLNGVSYINDGWFAEFRPSDELAIPISSDELIEEFRSDWNIKRKNEPGFSVLIPFADELDPYEILKTIIDEYSGKILEGTLEVHLEDTDYGEAEILTKETLLDFVEIYRNDPDRPEWSEIIRKVDALSWYHSLGGKADISLSSNGLSFKKGEWDLSEISDDLKSQARILLEESGRVCVRIPVMIHPVIEGKDKPSYFDVVICKVEGNKRSVSPEFFRKWLRISGQRAGKPNGLETYVMIHEGPLNELLRDAEGPAHTQWSDTRDKFRGRYRHGSSWLKFVKTAPSQVSNCLFGTEGDRDATALVDMFPKSLDIDGGKSGKKTSGSGVKGNTPGKPEDIPEGNDPRIELFAADDGFQFAVDEPGLVAFDMAFDVSRGNPFSKWHRIDFKAEELNVLVLEGDARVLSRSGNHIEVEILSGGRTKVSISGFKDERDLRVRAFWVEGFGR